MKYIKLFEEQLDLFEGGYKEDVMKVIHQKIDDFLNKEKLVIKNVINNSYETWFTEEKRTRKYASDIDEARNFTDFIKSADYDELKADLFESFFEHIEQVLTKSSIRLSKVKTDAFNIKYKDLYKMYEQHNPEKVIDDHIIDYYKKLFEEEPTMYGELRGDLPKWVKNEFSQEERGTKANLWDFQN